MLLGFIVFERGIEANPEKIAAIINMGPIKRFKGSTKGHGMPCGSEPLHLAPWRERIALVPPLKEGRALHLDSRGQISPRKLKGTPY
jgi:hypothetical protein